MPNRIWTVTLLAVLSLLFAACAASQPPQEVQVALSEFKINSSLAAFSRGTSYRFAAKNTGTVSHELMIMPRGLTKPSDAVAYIEAKDLPAGASKTLDFTFRVGGDYEFACRLPGHYEAGMLLPIVVK
ncbi:MAG: hypothetical protein HY685_01180 [Chloroflexi bacterium]|nr:hypothetical protein [Chloroflexota bacterium]